MQTSNFEGRPLNPPPAPPLPSFRVNDAPPFAYTAVDFTGPVYFRTKETGGNKAWIYLFTCCAIHLELVLDVLTVTFIRTLKCFSARRSYHKESYQTMPRLLKLQRRLSKFNHQEVKDYLSQVGVEWNFNLEKAPWWGGLFGRIKKRCLRKVIRQAKFSYDEMHTAIVEIDGVINSHPSLLPEFW